MVTVVQLGGAAMNDIRQLCSDSEVSDDGSSSGGGGSGSYERDRFVLCAVG